MALEIPQTMSARTPTGDRLAEWAALVDETVPEDRRPDDSGDR